MGSIDQFYSSLISPDFFRDHFKPKDAASIRLPYPEYIPNRDRSSQTANDAGYTNTRNIFYTLDSKNAVSHRTTPLYR